MTDRQPGTPDEPVPDATEPDEPCPRRPSPTPQTPTSTKKSSSPRPKSVAAEGEDDGDLADEDEDVEEAQATDAAGAAAATAPAVAATAADRPKTAAAKRAATPSELAVHDRDNISKWFVIAVTVVFVLILLNGIIGGRGGVLTPVATETPIVSESPAISPSAASSAAPSESPVSSPRCFVCGAIREHGAVRRPDCAGERFSRTVLIALRRPYGASPGMLRRIVRAMTGEPVDPAEARAAMVARQLRARGIEDERVLGAMASVPREAFLDERQRDYAYADEALPIESGQTISQPFVVARMSELLAARPGDRILEIGTGSGYQAAILAAMGCHVTSIERHPELARQARERLARGPAGRAGRGARRRRNARGARWRPLGRDHRDGRGTRRPTSPPGAARRRSAAGDPGRHAFAPGAARGDPPRRRMA